MTTHSLTVTPTTVSMEMRGNSGLFPSPLIQSAQTIDRGGAKWAATYVFANKREDDRGELLGLISVLRGQANRIRLPIFDNPKRGGYGGTPLVNGGSQTGNTLNIDGLTNKANWIRAGDYFSVVVNGEHELKMCTADATSSGGAISGLEFEPPLRAAPANNAVIYVEDGGGDVPEGIFLLEGSNAGWTSSPGAPSKLSVLQLAMIEDVFATQ